MKAASAALIDFLNTSQQCYMADLFRFQMIDGTTHRFTNWDRNYIGLGGNTWYANGPIFRHSKIAQTVGLEVDELSLTVMINPSLMLGSLTWIEAARNGVLDGCVVTLLRAFMPTPGDNSLGTVNRFRGRVSDVDGDESELSITVRSELELLDIKMPRNVYQPPCVHTLFDTGCALVKSGFETTTTVNTAHGAPARTMIPFDTAAAPGYYDLGTVRFVTGPNAGLTRSIKSQSPANQLHISLPLPAPCTNGDQIIVVPGCDKTKATCESKFANKANYRGYPYIPVADSVL